MYLIRSKEFYLTISFHYFFKNEGHIFLIFAERFIEWSQFRYLIWKIIRFYIRKLNISYLKIRKNQIFYDPTKSIYYLENFWKDIGDVLQIRFNESLFWNPQKIIEMNLAMKRIFILTWMISSKLDAFCIFEIKRFQVVSMVYGIKFFLSSTIW